ncbi:LysR family transcriptional regulator [Burkholderia sp. Ac-20379]|uniref:LysR family transcriptional regulator n=1 Tax=Burkholderia sp. Ac-20379 TaxID=2703900 RepID=UPI00197DCCE3|nr:LysR family transcriptional regulator [Burkholderia sp. Ac-20379]MBN3725316.1 LysR family transcriptional regulator [Burkholderia sp. Ac-20379]
MPYLPPLNALRAFEATARLGGFARAAAELHVSTSAVSHQIRALEAGLGARLLERSTGLGGIRITAAGERLLAAAGTALELIGAACAEIRGEARQLTVVANGPFSSMWLAQRLARFSARHPATSIYAELHDGEPDFARGKADLAIVHVSGDRLQPDDDVLLRETVVPVCSPELLPVASSALCRMRLLQEAHRNSPEIDWREWRERLDLPADFESKVVRYSSFSQVIGAALGGAGVALGRLPLIADELRSGRLVRLARGGEMAASWRFVVRRNPFVEHPMRETLLAYLREQAGI